MINFFIIMQNKNILFSMLYVIFNHILVTNKLKLYLYINKFLDY